jgi:hypothetical protein
MGGLGSGRTSGGGRTTVESCRSLDINRLRKVGVLTHGWSGGWEWTCNGEKIASIGIRGGRDRIVLVYRWRQTGSDWKDVVEPIELLWRSCRYGGERPYFKCPGVANGIPCNRSVAKLYCAGRYYFCRHCYRLTYTSRNEDPCDRALRRANKIRTRLGGVPGYEAPIPRRPKGMRRRTYDRLFEAVIENDSRAEERLSRMAARIMEFDASRRTQSRRRKGYWR